MSVLDDKWFEVWYVQGINTIPSYLVVVTPNDNLHGEIIVVDINENKVLHRSKNYEDVRNWLTEDEFMFVSGRVFSDDGWS